MKTYQKLQVAWIILAAATACLAAVSLCLAWTPEQVRQVAGMEEEPTVYRRETLAIALAGAGAVGGVVGFLVALPIGMRIQYRRLLKQWPEQGGPVNPPPPRAPRRDVPTP